MPSSDNNEEVVPALVFTFEQLPLGIIELEPDIFLVLTSNVYTDHKSSRSSNRPAAKWQTGTDLAPELICSFPNEARGLNGCCLLAPGVVLIADCFASRIWRLDLRGQNDEPTVSKWLEHESMSYYPGTMKPEQPGVNAVRYASRTNYLYYTSTAKKLLYESRA